MANNTWNIGLTGDDDGEDAIVGTVQENLRLLGTWFAGATAPPNPFLYQVWIDETAGVVKQWNGAAFVVILGRLLGRSLAQALLLGTVTATRTLPIAIARPGFTVTALKLYHLTATTSDATDKWTFDLRRDSDSALMFATPPTTNGDDLAAKTVKTWTPDQNQTVATGGVSLVMTGGGTPPTLTDLLVVLEGYEANP